VAWRIDEIDWDNSNTPHVFEHGFDASEIEEILFTSASSPKLIRGPDEKVCIFGQTQEGRYSFIVGRLVEATISLVSVHKMGKQQKRWYKEMKEPRYEAMPTGTGGEEDFDYWYRAFSA